MAAHHRLARTQPFDGGDPSRLNESWAAAHGDFHQALIEGCGSPRLLDLASSLRDSAEIYRRWSFRSEGRARDVAGEHQALLHASLARNIDRAEEILSNHLQRTADSLMSQLAASDRTNEAPAHEIPHDHPANADSRQLRARRTEPPQQTR